MAAPNVAMDGDVVWKPPKTYKAMQKMCHDDLTRAEVASLKFLCKDLVSAGKLEDITDTLKLFAELENLGLMTSEENMSILIELLYYINRKDILSKLNVTREYISFVLRRPKISSYRILLFNFCENTMRPDLEDLKYLCGAIGVASSAVESVKTAEDLILLLERSTDEDYFPALESFLTNALRSLLDLPNETASGREASVVSPTDDLTENPDTDIGGDALEVYPMNKPGFCFIINNLKFLPGSKHEDRVGSEIDEKNLMELFRRTLRFEVVVRNDLRAQQMVAELHNVARHINNDKYSCFVCCILSHGTDGAVYGVDDGMILIRQMMEIFKVENCPGMRDKPKIFFLQACQGTKLDIYIDGTVDDDEPEDPVISLPEMDDPSSSTPGSGSIPSERDFLLAYSAVPGYASFRSSSSGTFFISTLVEVIREKHKTTNLMEMLTLVTGRVSRIRAPMEVTTRDSNGIEIKVMKEFYQVPAPLQTLTKLLYWR